jgi:hypothetical protein
MTRATGVAFIPAGSCGSYTEEEEEEGVSCEIEKSDSVVFEKLSLTWQILDFRRASAIDLDPDSRFDSLGT